MSTLSTLSTHVLDTALGQPAVGIRVELERSDGTLIVSGVTDDNGRLRDFGEPLSPGSYRLRFHVAEFFSGTERETFYDEIVVAFRVGNDAHYHVPLLLSPYGYSTYRGTA